jgi:major membrane immunogen (membrane-anchored lipoprotein)
VDNGETKAFFFDDQSFQKLGFKQDFLTNLQTGKIVQLKAQYDDRGNVLEVEEA